MLKFVLQIMAFITLILLLLMLAFGVHWQIALMRAIPAYLIFVIIYLVAYLLTQIIKEKQEES